MNLFNVNKWLLKILLSFNLLFSTFSAFTQVDIDRKLKSFLEIELSKNWAKIVHNEHSIEYTFTDSLDLCYFQDLSPIRHYCLDTLTVKSFYIKLDFESAWNRRKLDNAKNENNKILKVICNRIINVGDSLNWQGMKTNKDMVASNPLTYTRFVKNWTAEELALMQSIKELPLCLYKGYGVFVERNADYVSPQKKQMEIEYFYLELEKMGLILNKVYKKDRLNYQTVFYFFSKRLN
jgi:hypothetical protein